jgi:hypothetical protein
VACFGPFRRLLHCGVPLLLTLALALQAPPEPLPAPRATAAVRAGLDTLYGGAFPAATRHFAHLAAADTADPAPVVFEAGAYIWWAAALDSGACERRR